MSPLQKIQHPLFQKYNLNVYVKRDDLIHPFISGNKWRKCHYLLKHIKSLGFDTAVTFGGAYSNHIHAFSYACKELGIKSIGIIRGEELASKPLNSTLIFAQENGMELRFVSRDEYKKRYNDDYINQLMKDNNAYVVPEGGTTLFAIDGFKDMLDEIRDEVTFDGIFVPCGSAGTVSGINANLLSNELVYAVNVLKGTEPDIVNTLTSFSDKSQFDIVSDYHFGGYAKSNEVLNSFIEDFQNRYGFEIEPVYSGKMFYAFFDMVEKEMFHDKTLILCHTGGLQGKKR
jgi:1-aminocyclopropane-1-carboxylate deaminase